MKKCQKKYKKYLTTTKKCGIIIYRKGVMPMDKKIKELIKLLEQLNKLLLKVIELAGTVTLLALSIKGLLEIL